MFLFKKKETGKISESDLERALKKGEFVFYYQPEFDLKTEKVIAVEALMRWNAPNGIVPPGEFIPVLEQSGLIRKFNSFLLHQTLTDLKTIHEAGYPNIAMAINVSAVQLDDKAFVPAIQKALKETETDAKFLECEITETHQLSHPQMKEAIFKELSKLGISISLDDFGTGYSSFNYLRCLDFKKLKIDCDFVRSLSENIKNRTILSLIIQLGHILKIPVLAEGIETTEQKDWLEKNGCDFGQGFWFARPLPLDQLLTFLEKKKKN